MRSHYAVHMAGRVARVTGTVTTLGAGVLLGMLALSTYGFGRTFFVLVALALIASVMERVISRQR